MSCLLQLPADVLETHLLAAMSMNSIAKLELTCKQHSTLWKHSLTCEASASAPAVALLRKPFDPARLNSLTVLGAPQQHDAILAWTNSWIPSTTYTLTHLELCSLPVLPFYPSLLQSNASNLRSFHVKSAEPVYHTNLAIFLETHGSQLRSLTLVGKQDTPTDAVAQLCQRNIATFCPLLEHLEIRAADWSIFHTHSTLRRLYVHDDGYNDQRFLGTGHDLKVPVANQLATNPPKVGLNLMLASHDRWESLLSRGCFHSQFAALDELIEQNGLDIAFPHVPKVNATLFEMSQRLPTLQYLVGKDYDLTRPATPYRDRTVIEEPLPSGFAMMMLFDQAPQPSWEPFFDLFLRPRLIQALKVKTPEELFHRNGQDLVMLLLQAPLHRLAAAIPRLQLILRNPQFFGSSFNYQTPEGCTAWCICHSPEAVDLVHRFKASVAPPPDAHSPLECLARRFQSRAVEQMLLILEPNQFGELITPAIFATIGGENDFQHRRVLDRFINVIPEARWVEFFTHWINVVIRVVQPESTHGSFFEPLGEFSWVSRFFKWVPPRIYPALVQSLLEPFDFATAVKFYSKMSGNTLVKNFSKLTHLPLLLALMETGHIQVAIEMIGLKLDRLAAEHIVEGTVQEAKRAAARKLPEFRQWLDGQKDLQGKGWDSRLGSIFAAKDRFCKIIGQD